MTERMQLFNKAVTGKGINMLYSVYSVGTKNLGHYFE